MMASMSTNTDNVYVESIITIILETGVDISDASAFYIDVKFPEGHDPATDQWTGEIEGTTQIKYTTSETDLDVAGKYYLQAIVPSATPTGDIVGDTCVLVVKERFK